MKKATKNKLKTAEKVMVVVGNVFDTIINILIVVVIAYIVYKGAALCYNYGYRVYTEPAMTVGEGREVTVTIPTDFTARELGEIFEANGLTKDHILLTLQYYFSENREYVKSGTYTLSTSMNAEEMFASIAEINIAKEEEQKALEEAQQAQRESEEQSQSNEEDEEDYPLGVIEGEEGSQEIDMSGEEENLLEDSVR